MHMFVRTLDATDRMTTSHIHTQVHTQGPHMHIHTGPIQKQGMPYNNVSPVSLHASMPGIED